LKTTSQRLRPRSPRPKRKQHNLSSRLPTNGGCQSAPISFRPYVRRPRGFRDRDRRLIGSCGSPHHGPRLSHGGAVSADRIGGHARRCTENPKFGTIETTMLSKSKFAESWPVVAAFAARRRCCALEWEQWRECAQRRGNLPQCPISPDPSSPSKRLRLKLTNISATITSAAVGGMPVRLSGPAGLDPDPRPMMFGHSDGQRQRQPREA
jgi:hypothetical protein